MIGRNIYFIKKLTKLTRVVSFFIFINYKNMKKNIKMYFAGKVFKGGGYRNKLLNNDRAMSELGKIYDIKGYTKDKSPISFSIEYVGPLAISDDHGCFHGSGTHGIKNTYCIGSYSNYEKYITVKGNSDLFFKLKNDTLKRCTKQIKNCDIFYARIDDLTCYGTFMEIGIAYILKKFISI
jgi:hypothetical protein